MILVYKGHSTAGSQTSVRLDWRVVWHEPGRCTAIWAEDASRNKRKGQAEKWGSTWRETDRYTVLVYANHAEVTHATIVVFLVVATISATIDSGLCGNFPSFRLTLWKRNEWHSLLLMSIFYLSQRMRESIMTYSSNEFYISRLSGNFTEIKTCAAFLKIQGKQF